MNPMKYIKRNMNAFMVYSIFTIAGLFCGFCFAFFSLESSPKGENNFSRWNEMRLDVVDSMIIWETFATRVELFLDGKGGVIGFNMRERFLEDASCSINYSFDVKLNKNEKKCWLRIP